MSTSSINSVGREVGDFVMGIMKEWIQKLKYTRPSGHEFEQEFKKAPSDQATSSQARQGLPGNSSK